MLTEVYRNAFTEVYEIISYLDESDYNKIPREVISVIEENRNQDYEYFLDESISFEEQEMLPETKAILFNFFRDYWCTNEQKEKIFNFQKSQRAKLEEEKRKNYNGDIFRKNEVNTIVNVATEETALIKAKKNKFGFKIFDCIKRIFNKLLKGKNDDARK